jgi:hypothetical protein
MAAAMFQQLRGRVTIRLPCCPAFAANGRARGWASIGFCRAPQRFDISTNGCAKLSCGGGAAYG